MKKCVTIFANLSITQEIVEILKGREVEGYTQWPRIIGAGPVTGPRLDSHIWPGANVGFQVVTDEITAENLMDDLQELRDSETGKQSGVYAYMTVVERVLE